MRNTFPDTRILRHALVGLAFLGLVAIVSLPVARGAGPVGWMPMWLLGMPLVALAALALADLRGQTRQAAPVNSPAVTRRRARPTPQARYRMAARPASRRRAAAPAA